MFDYLHTENGREVYFIKYNEENYDIYFNPKTKEIEQILPVFQTGVSTVARLFTEYIEKNHL